MLKSEPWRASEPHYEFGALQVFCIIVTFKIQARAFFEISQNLRESELRGLNKKFRAPPN